MMKNVTLSLENQILGEARVKAAQLGKSLSGYLADLVRKDIEAGIGGASAETREKQIEALERVLNGPKWAIMREGRMPTADERNER